jgi:hypothetical protein
MNTSTPTPSIFEPITTGIDAPLNNNFGLVLAIDALNTNTMAHMVAAITEDPKDPRRLIASVQFRAPSRTLACLLMNAIMEEIDKVQYDDLLSEPDENENSPSTGATE